MGVIKVEASSLDDCSHNFADLLLMEEILPPPKVPAPYVAALLKQVAY